MNEAVLPGHRRKTIDENFRDWESEAFGYGYGSGEPHTIPALRRFLDLCRDGTFGRAYDYEALEADLTPTVTWLLINVLIREDIIEYGTSPRAGWLTDEGERLRDYMLSKTEDELVAIACDYESSEYDHCMSSACNCGPNGYEEGRVCPNPFWRGHNRTAGAEGI